jgi:hypothetical protein
MPRKEQSVTISRTNSISSSFRRVFLELLAKARLAAIHPSLIIDKDFDSLLHACAAGKHTKRLPWQVKTVTATEALKRCTQLHPELLTFESRLKLLAEYRNSTHSPWRSSRGRSQATLSELFGRKFRGCQRIRAETRRNIR